MAPNFVDPILVEKEVAEWLGISSPNLQRMRADGSGPPFIQLSERRIGYRLSTIERWLESRTINRIGAFKHGGHEPTVSSGRAS
jgi:predicted DNA-binding transcriptional regulator AlpA